MRRQREQQRGAIAVLAAIVLIAIGGFLALSLNVGHKMNVKAQLQASMDAAALAGAGELNGTTPGLGTAHSTATDFATRHFLDSDAVTIDINSPNTVGGDVETGYWDVRNNVFHPEGDSVFIGDFNMVITKDLTPQFMNAVRVHGGADGLSGHNNPLKVFFSSFVGGISTLKVKAGAVAMAGGPCRASKNVVPIEVSSCALTDSFGQTLCGQNVILTLDGPTLPIWTIAFADLTPPAVTVTDSEVGQQFVDAWNNNSPEIDAFPLPGDIDSAITSTAGTATTAGLTAGPLPNNMPPAAYCPCTAFPGGVCPVNNAAPSGCTRVRMPVVNGHGQNKGPCGTADSMHTPTVTPIGFVTVAFRVVNLAPGAGIARTIQVYIDCTQAAVTDPLAFDLGRAGCPNFGYPALRDPTTTFTRRITSLVQ